MRQHETRTETATKTKNRFFEIQLNPLKNLYLETRCRLNALSSIFSLVIAMVDTLSNHAHIHMERVPQVQIYF